MRKSTFSGRPESSHLKLIPFCKVEQTTAQNEAFTTGDMDLYLIRNFLIILLPIH